MTSPHRGSRIAGAVGVVALSSLWWWAASASSTSHRATLTGFGTDHHSHWGTVLLFARRGLEIYRRPVRDLCADATGVATRDQAWVDRERNALCWVEGFDRPLAINWQDHPRPYPPGHLAFFLPEALVYRFGAWTFGATNRLAVWQMTLAAHLAAVLFALLLRGRTEGAVPIVAAAFAYLELLHWALEGFYDAAGIACILWSLLALARRRPTQALLAYCLAVSLHLRALWYLPIAAVAAARIWRGEAAVPSESVHGAPTFERGRKTMLAAAAVLLVSAGVSLSLLLSHLSAFDANNPLRGPGATRWSAQIVGFVLATALFAGCALHHRSRLLLACLVASGVFFVSTVQVQWWHSLWLLPMLLIGVTDHGRRPATDLVATGLVWYLILSRALFGNSVLWFEWLGTLGRQAGS
jgi:hypothetical protein